MISETITLPMVEGLIASRKPLPPAIKQQFETDSRNRHARRLRVQIIAGALVYNAVLAADVFLVPDVWQISALLHLAIVTPLMIAAALAMPRLQARIARELVACAVAMVLCLQYLFVFLATRSPYADHYQYFVLLDMLFLSMTLRPSFRVYLVVAAIAFILHSLAVHLFSQLQWQEGAMASLVLLVGTYITVMGCLSYDRRERRSYLFRLRETLRHAEADVASRRDRLTGFLNRGGLDKALEELWRGRHSQIAAIMIDVDHFKSYNDRYGHLAGDACVKKIAALIADASRQPHDILARFGGDEFLVLLPNTDLREGSRVAERMRRALQEAAIPQEGNAPGGCVTASFGVGSAITKTMHPRELIASADAALYCVKRNGRDGIWPQADRPVLSVVGPRVNEYERRLA